MKNYTVKIFDLDGVTLLRTLNPNEIMGGFSWSEQLNGGQGEFVLRLKLGFSSTAVAHSQIVRVYSQDSTYSPGTQRLLYTGIISILRRVSDMDGEYIEMRCLGISAILAWVFYASPSGNYNFTKNEAQDDIVMNLLDEFEVNYPNIISYTAGTSIEALGSTAHLDFYYESMLSALKKIIDTVDWYWRVDREGVFQFHPRSGGANPVTHILTISKDIELLDVEEDTEGIVNEYFVKYSGGAIETASDATSISTY